MLNMGIYYLFFYFILYSFLGWCLEVVYHLTKKDGFINRGFLFGPLCPIYGIGALALIILLEPLKSNLFLLLIGSFIFPSLIEYIVGFFLEKIFNTIWWDYSNDILNLKGRICAKFSIIWWIFSLMLLLYIQPVLIEPFVKFIPITYGTVAMYFVLICIIIDFVITLLSLFKLKMLFSELYIVSLELRSKLEILKELKEPLSHEEITNRAKNISHKFTGKLEYINHKFNNTVDNFVNIRENLAHKGYFEIFHNLETKVDELKITYDNLLSIAAKKYSRIFRAYPNLKTKVNSKTLTDIKNKIVSTKNNLSKKK